MAQHEVVGNSNQAVEERRVEKAPMAGVENLTDQVNGHPRSILPVLEALDKQRRDQELLQLIEQLDGQEEIRLERLVFRLRVKFRAGDMAGSIVEIESILALAPNHVEALRTGGRIYNLQKNEDLALTHWERLAMVSAADPEAALQAARIRARRQDHLKALEWAQRAAGLRQDKSEALQIAVSAGRELGWPEECDTLLAQLFAIDRVRGLRAATQIVTELETENAARILSLLIEQQPHDKGLANLVEQTYPNWMLAALEQELASHDLEAAVFYRAARRLKADIQDPQSGLDRLSRPSLVAMREAFNGRDYEAAIQHGTIATRIDPKCLEAWQTVARANFTRGDVTKALEAFAHCTEMQPGDGRTWFTQGLMLNHIGDRPGALAALQKAKQLGGSADAQLRTEAEASIAALYAQLVRDAQQAVAEGDFNQAWLCCEAAASVKSKDPEIERLKGRIVRELREQIRGQWEAQSPSLIQLCWDFLKKEPNDRYVGTVLGRTLMVARKYADALPVWEELSKSNPTDSHLHLQVARCCRSLKIRDRGLAAAQVALRLDPQLQEAAELAEYLRSLATAASPASDPLRR